MTTRFFKPFVFVLLAALVLFAADRSALAQPPCSEGQQTSLRRLVQEHKQSIAAAEAKVDRQRAINANEALSTGHVSYPNEARLITYQHDLNEWRHVADRDSARYEACFGYPPIALKGLGTNKPHSAAPVNSAPAEEKTKWSGTWYQGPYTIQVSGGNGSLSYTSDRESDVGTCCPTTDQGSGSCTVEGNVATCTGKNHFHNSASDIWVDEARVTLTYQGESIGVKEHIIKAHEKTDQYHPCPESGPEMSKCTRLYPGNDLSGTWSRQKPQ